MTKMNIYTYIQYIFYLIWEHLCITFYTIKEKKKNPDGNKFCPFYISMLDVNK